MNLKGKTKQLISTLIPNCSFQTKVIVAFALCSCLQSANSQENAEDDGTQKGKVFYLQLYKALNRRGNFLFSPVSVETWMYLAYDGSQGTTSDVIQRVVWPSPSQSPTDRYNTTPRTIRSSDEVAIFFEPSKIYVSDLLNLSSTYVDAVKSKFLTDVESINFSNGEEVAATINNWVLNVTNREITGLINKTDFDHHRYASMLMLSCLDFTGAWKKTFRVKHTKLQPFYLNDMDSKQVKMMHMANANFDILVDDRINANVLVLPLADKHFVLTIFLPNQRGKIEDMKKKLFSLNVTVGEFMKNATKRTVNFALPIFKLESTVKLKDALINVSNNCSKIFNKILTNYFQMGLEEIFSSNANFSGMIDQSGGIRQVFVDDIIQKSYFEIHEVGAEGAIGTGLYVLNKKFTNCKHVYVLVEKQSEKRTKRSANESTIDFIVDHPFVFFLSVGDAENGFFDLFSGQVYNPLEW